MRRGNVTTAAFKIALVYLAFGVTWILVSSSFVDIKVDPDWQGAFEIGKGFFFVLVTACVLYVLIRHTFSNVAELSDQVAEQDTFLDLALAAGQSAAYEWDLTTDHVEWSSSAHFIPGDASLLAKCKLPGTFGTDPDQDLDAIDEKVEVLVKSGQPFVAVLMSVEDGRTRWFENRGAPTITLGVAKVVGVVTDISERVESQRNLASLTKSLDVEVKLRTESLFTANKELQAFNQAVAHDLRGPLRAIHGYAIQLKEETEVPNEEQTHLVDKIVGVVRGWPKCSMVYNGSDASTRATSTKPNLITASLPTKSFLHCCSKSQVFDRSWFKSSQASASGPIRVLCNSSCKI